LHREEEWFIEEYKLRLFSQTKLQRSYETDKPLHQTSALQIEYVTPIQIWGDDSCSMKIQFFWRICFVHWYKVTDVSEAHTTSIFSAKQVQERWRQTATLKRRYICTNRHSALSSKPELTLKDICISSISWISTIQYLYYKCTCGVYLQVDWKWISFLSMDYFLASYYMVQGVSIKFENVTWSFPTSTY
jgi:hypothetical protein